MKQVLDMKFEDFPLNVPSEKRIVKKLESLVQELEEKSKIIITIIIPIFKFLLFILSYYFNILN